MPSQNYLFRTPRKTRSSNGVGSSTEFLFGLSRGFYLPPREKFHRYRDLNQVSKRASPKGFSPEPAKRPAGLGNVLARLLGRHSESA